MGDFSHLVEQAISGRDPIELIEGVGQDRQDDIQSEQDKLRAFYAITGQIQDYKGYVGPDWITHIADSMASGQPDAYQNVLAVAKKNRDDYMGGVRIADSGGTPDMWDRITKGLLATRTDQLPPLGA